MRLCLPGIPHMAYNPLHRWSRMIAHPRPLIEVCAAISDFRKPRGKRHPLNAIFALACCAMLCGYRSYSAMAEWGRNYGARLAQALGFTHDTPCAATLHTIFRRVNRAEFEAPLGAWADSVVGSLPAACLPLPRACMLCRRPGTCGTRLAPLTATSRAAGAAWSGAPDRAARCPPRSWAASRARGRGAAG